MNVNEELERLHESWFGPHPAEGVPEEKINMWFNGDEETDRWLAEEFGELYETVTSDDNYNEIVLSLENRRQKVGLILLLDQIPRNLFRGEPEAFARGRRARELAGRLVRSGEHRDLSMWERGFVYLPFEHSEDLADQRRSVELFEQLAGDSPQRWMDAAEEFLDYAREHQKIIQKFGRFPHRNEILGRESRTEEKKFLNKHGRGF